MLIAAAIEVTRQGANTGCRPDSTRNNDVVFLSVSDGLRE
jgi:hypothetical protein